MIDFTITKREILFSVAIVCLMLIFGFLIADNINTALLHDQQEYNTALQIENDKELFEYGMRTNIGNTFVYGDLKALDPVSHDEISGEYAYIERVKEEHTKHTRTYTTTDGKGHTKTHTQTYWTWDRVGYESWHCEKISFLDHEFEYKAIPFPSSEYLQTNTYGSIRYKFYVCKTEYVGTLYATLADDTVSDAKFYQDMTIEQTIKDLESGWQLTVFWIGWILFTIAVVIAFYYLNNRWLEG